MNRNPFGLMKSRIVKRCQERDGNQETDEGGDICETHLIRILAFPLLMNMIPIIPASGR